MLVCYGLIEREGYASLLRVDREERVHSQAQCRHMKSDSAHNSNANDFESRL
jgi:hypothetical protein